MFMRQVIVIGGRQYAVPKPLGLADKVANKSRRPSNWPHEDRCSGRARVIVNQKFR